MNFQSKYLVKEIVLSEYDFRGPPKHLLRFNFAFQWAWQIPDNDDYSNRYRVYHEDTLRLKQWCTDTFGPFMRRNGTWWIDENQGWLRIYLANPKQAVLFKLSFL